MALYEMSPCPSPQKNNLVSTYMHLDCKCHVFFLRPQLLHENRQQPSPLRHVICAVGHEQRLFVFPQHRIIAQISRHPCQTGNAGDFLDAGSTTSLTMHESIEIIYLRNWDILPPPSTKTCHQNDWYHIFLKIPHPLYLTFFRDVPSNWGGSHPKSMKIYKFYNVLSSSPWTLLHVKSASYSRWAYTDHW